MASKDRGAKTLDRRGFLGGVLKLSAGAAALSVLPSCEVGELGGSGRRSCGGGGSYSSFGLERTAEPRELLEPMTMSMVLEEKWRIQSITRRPDTHLRVRLVDINTNNPLDIEVFSGPDAQKRAIAATDSWEFYTYNADERGQQTPDHVVDAINQLAAVVLNNEHKPAIAKLNGTVCLFEERQPDEPISSEKPAITGETGA